MTDPTSTSACRFCEIVAGIRPAHWVVRTGDVRAFLDARPLFPGHTLVVPARHVDYLDVLPDDLLEPLGRTVRAVSRALRAPLPDGLAAEGTFVATNTIVSQSVPHLHVHVVPRRPKDGLRGFFWPRTRYASDAEAEAIADQLRMAVIL